MGAKQGQTGELSFNTLHKASSPYNPPIPYPNRLNVKPKMDEQFGEIYDIFSKVHINLPLLEAIKKVPAYGQFFKNLITGRKRFTKDEKVLVSQAASVAL